jgi:hypothetical protein
LAEIDDEIARHKQRIEELERRKLRVLEQLK